MIGSKYLMAMAVFFFLQGTDSGLKAETEHIQSEEKLPGKAVLSPGAYALIAMDAVKNKLLSEGIPAEEYRLELAAPPVLKPDCSEFHPNGSRPGQGMEVASRMPEAFVHIHIFGGNVLQERATVVFMEGEPAVRLSGRKSPGSDYSVGVMDSEEMQQVADGLDPFFITAVDVSRSSERFYSFFPLNIRSLLKHPDRNFRLNVPPGAVEPSWRDSLLKETGARNVETTPLDGLDSWKDKLSDKDLRRFVAMTLDLAVQQTWLALEGLKSDPDSRLQPQLLVSKPRDYIKSLEKTVRQNRKLLEESGTLSPRHFRTTCDYIQQMIGRSLIVKEVSAPEPCPCFLLPFSGEGFVSGNQHESEVMNNLPAEAKLYLFGISGLRLHFSDIESYPRLVCVAQN